MVKKGRIVAFMFVVLSLGLLIGITHENITDRIKLGLDLQGGFEVLYEVVPPKENEKVAEETLKATVSALRNRIDVIGVAEPNIQIEGEKRIRVQLAGVEDQSDARELLSTQAELTFRDVDDQLMLSGSDLESNGARLTFSETNQPEVALTLKDANKFGEVTQEILAKDPEDRHLVIWLDYEEGDSFQEEMLKPDPKYLSAPTVSKVLNTKDVVIQGVFQVDEATQLAELLNAGSLPVELEEVYSTSVGAQFGQQAMEKTIVAGAIAIVLIFIYMIAYYRFPGVIAAITLSIYIYFILVVFGWMNAVLTLPGIAALVLGVGMAVDANILTYERIKEELKSGKTVMSAFRVGGRRAFSTILDANITTLIAAGVMFFYGTSSVKGFAIMLIISILVSFLTAVYGSRVLLGFWVRSRLLDDKPHLFGVKRDDIVNLSRGEQLEVNIRFNFVGHRKKFFSLTIILFILGTLSLTLFGLNLGTDFQSGSRVEITGDEAKDTTKVKEQFEEINFTPNELTVAGENNEMIVARFSTVLSQQEIAQVKEHFHSYYGTEPNVSTVSPQVGRELAKNGFIALLIALVGMIIYVAIRFEWLKGLAAIISLAHNAFFMVAIFSLLRLEVNITFIAAVLTIIGYSINDTIVTFDRIRENMKLEKAPRTFAELTEIVNRSLQQTLARSINTVLTVLFGAIALTFFGGEAIRIFSIALLIGLTLGAYSSIFIAAQLWVIFKGRELKKPREA